MHFQAGDAVMHWSYGLGTIIRLEKRNVLGQTAMYYAVNVGGMTVWVPEDDKLKTRLRPPTSRARFPKILAGLKAPGDPLPMDRHERKLKLSECMQTGRVESLVEVIRALGAFSRIHSLNDYDQSFLRRARSLLAGEWGYALSVTPEEADTKLQHLIAADR